MKPASVRQFWSFALFFLLIAVPGITFAQNSIISISSPSVMEGDAGTTTMRFVATFDCVIAINMPVEWQANDDTATTANNDYVDVISGPPAPGYLDNVCPNASGPTDYNLDVQIVGDTDIEPDETVQVEFTVFGVGTPSFDPDAGPRTSTGTILNDDVLEADIQVSVMNNSDMPVIAGQAGSLANWTWTVTNAGPSDSDVTTVINTMNTGSSIQTNCSVVATPGTTYAFPNWDLGTLPAGESRTLTRMCEYTSASEDGATISHTMSVNSTSVPDPVPGNDSGTVQATIGRIADLEITKTASVTDYTPGDPVPFTYTITATNLGPSDTNDAVVTDTFPAVASCSWTSMAADGASGNTAGPVMGDIADGPLDMPAGSSVTYTATCTVDPSAADGVMPNTATVSASEDSTPGNNSSAWPILLIRRSELSITKVANEDPVIAGGDPFTWTIEVTNAGPSDAANVVITDTPGANLTLVDTSGCMEDPTGVPTCTIASIAANSSAMVTVTTTADAAAAEGEILTNDVSVASDSDEDNLADNSDQGATTATRVSDIAVSKTDDPDPVVAGTELTYEVTATNNGPSNAANLTVSDDVPAQTTFVSATPTGAGVCTTPAVGATGNVSCTWAADTVPTGMESVTIVVLVDPSAAVGDTISNTAMASSDSTDNNPKNDQAVAETEVIRHIDLTVTKSDDPDPVVAGFELGGLEYVIEVTNNGPSDGDGVVVNDPTSQWPVGVVLESSSATAGTYDGTDWVVDLPAGSNETLTLVVTVGPATVPGDDAIENVAMVTGSGGDEIIIAPFDDDTATEFTTVLPTTATWTVSKDFLDDTSASITATLTCTSGEVTGPIQVTEGNPGELTVERFLMGPFGTTTCEVTEELPPDYFQVSASEDCEVEGVVHEDEFDCDFVNAPIRATFEVTKDFTDDNPADVRVVIECNTGLPLMQEGVVSEFGNPFDKLTFVVQDYEVGTLNCEVFEDPVPTGYQQSYEASRDPVDAIGGFGQNADECFFTEVETGTFGCAITNTLLPVDVTVNKEWIDDRPGFNNPLWVEITFSCNAHILGDDCNVAEGGCGIEGSDSVMVHIDPDNPGEFQVLPHWDGSTVCSATEEIQPGVIVDQEDCAAIPLAPGQGGECTIVNTRFYEGIPTLSQYGLMLLSLLMLGMGMFAFRRMA